MKQQLAEVNRFAFSGFLVAGIDFITFIALQSADLERVKANGIAMLFGFIAGFFLHKNFSFRHQGSASYNLWLRYFLVFVANIILGSVLMYASKAISLDALVAKLLVMASVAISSFFLSKLFVFNSPQAR